MRRNEKEGRKGRKMVQTWWRYIFHIVKYLAVSAAVRFEAGESPVSNNFTWSWMDSYGEDKNKYKQKGRGKKEKKKPSRNEREE